VYDASLNATSKGWGGRERASPSAVMMAGDGVMVKAPVKWVGGSNRSILDVVERIVVVDLCNVLCACWCGPRAGSFRLRAGACASSAKPELVLGARQRQSVLSRVWTLGCHGTVKTGIVRVRKGKQVDDGVCACMGSKASVLVGFSKKVLQHNNAKAQTTGSPHTRAGYL
jgi:hypothetical protein